MLKRFAALFAAALTVGTLFCAISHTSFFSWESIVRGKPLVFYSSTEQLKNIDFQRACYEERVHEGDNPVLVFGSSELSPREGSPFYPAQFWTNRNYGMNIQSEGRAYFTSLWDAVQVGAMSSYIEGDRRKVVIMPSFTWFLNATKYGNDKKQISFSRSTLDAFEETPDIPDSLKDEIRHRLEFYGVLDSVDEGFFQLDSFVDDFDESASQSLSDINLRWKTLFEPDQVEKRNFEDEGSHSQPLPTTRFGELETPNWDKIIEDSQRRAIDKSSNEYGFEDSWYKNGFEKWLKSTEKWKVDPSNYFNENEFEEFEWFLQICRNCDIDVLVVITPVNAKAWDLSPIGSSVRKAYYERLSSMALEYGAALSDLSAYENDPYFCRDYHHPSEYGWSMINKAIYEFYYK